MTTLVSNVLGAAGELRARDAHASVEAVTRVRVSPSALKNCLAVNARGDRIMLASGGLDC